MDALVKQIAKRGMDHPLALDPRFADEGRALDEEAEMAFPGGVVAAVPAMLFAVVDKVELRRSQRRFEPPPHFHCDWAGVRRVHRAYIGRLGRRGSVGVA